MPALLYTKTRRHISGQFETDLINSAGKDWDAAYWLSNGIFSTGRRPCFVNYRGDIYVAGAYSRVLVRPKVDRRMLPAGIAPVRIKIAVANGSGSGGSTATGVLAFVTLLHKEGDIVLAESDRSNVVDVGASTGAGWNWSNLPTTGEDFRVTHIRGYRSVDGADYRKAWESPFGIPTFTENVLTQNLTVLGPPAGRNGVPPKGVHFMTDFGGRMFYGRTAEHPYRLWWSAPGFPEYVNVENDYVDTWDRSALTGIAKARNELMGFVQRECYKVRQFGQEELNDFVLVKVDNASGCINHFGIVEIHNRLWLPAEDGMWIYDGGFRYLMRDFRTYWVRDYKANKLAFQTGFGYDDKSQKTYVFATGRDPAVDLGEKTDLLCGSVAYVGTYESFEPSMGGTNPEPDWTLDVYRRRNSAALYDSAGDVLLGSCDAIIRKHDPLDGDDDGDLLRKALIIRHGHDVYRQPGDDIESGKTLTDFWAYVESELNDWVLYLLGGDEDAWNQVRPDNVWRFWRRRVVASLKTYTKTIGGVTKTLKALPKTVHKFQPSRVSGRGWFVEIRAEAPIGLKYRGHGGSFEPGPADQPAELETAFTLGLQWRVDGDVLWQDTPIAATKRQQTSAAVVLELRAYYENDYGIVLPIDLTLDYAGTNMPVDATNQITVASEKVVDASFAGVDTVEANGSLTLSAEEAGNVPARNSPLVVPVVVNTWDFELQYRIDGGAWTPYTTTIVLTTLQVLELQVETFGTRFPTAIRRVFNAVPTDLDPVAAPGVYLSEVIPYPGSGLGTYVGSITYFDGPVGGVALGSDAFSVQWT